MLGPECGLPRSEPDTAPLQRPRELAGSRGLFHSHSLAENKHVEAGKYGDTIPICRKDWQMGLYPRISPPDASLRDAQAVGKSEAGLSGAAVSSFGMT